MTTTEKSDATAAQASTRERILRATLRMIGEQGIGAISNRRLAAEAGVALGSLTYHFPSQNELLRESLMLFGREEVERLEAVATAIRNTAPNERDLAQTIEQVIESSALGPEQIGEIELYLQAARDPELRDAAKRCFAAYDSIAVAALQALGIPEPERHARTIVAYISGLAVRNLASGSRDASGTAEALLIFLRGLRAS